MLLRLLLLLLFPLIQAQALAYALPSLFEKSTAKWKAIVFLSSSCPCSKSHVDHLNQLKKKFDDFELFGVATDSFSGSNQTQINSYYMDSKFKFPVIKDSDQSLLKKYKALKTPHVVLFERVEGKYQKIYEGGVSNQRDFSKSDKKFLEANLLALSKGKKPPFKRGQSLGCYIRRI